MRDGHLSVLTLHRKNFMVRVSYNTVYRDSQRNMSVNNTTVYMSTCVQYCYEVGCTLYKLLDEH